MQFFDKAAGNILQIIVLGLTLVQFFPINEPILTLCRSQVWNLFLDLFSLFFQNKLYLTDNQRSRDAIGSHTQCLPQYTW